MTCPLSPRRPREPASPRPTVSSCPLASFPADSLNHNRPESGNPPDSIRPDSALVQAAFHSRDPASGKRPCNRGRESAYWAAGAAILPGRLDDGEAGKPMLDLLVRGANLPDGRVAQDIAVKDGHIAEIGPAIQAKAAREIDARGRLVTPPFVDSHFHMDSTLSLGQPRLNASGTLLEGIALWGELKPQLTGDAIKARARALCHWAIARGTLAIRSHVD